MEDTGCPRDQKIKHLTLEIRNFIQTFINYFLFLREVYPNNYFLRRSYYGLDISVLAHPELEQYIDEIMNPIEKMVKFNC
jgi:hypothetical protein